MNKPFFNRAFQKECFKRKFDQKPLHITVVVGPRDCGKTALLERTAAEIRADDNGAPIVVLDGRMQNLTTPEGISRALCNEVTLQSLLHKFKSLRSLSFNNEFKLKSSAARGLPKASLTLDDLFKLFKEDTEDLRLTITKLHQLFIVFNQRKLYPVIIIDQANELMLWKESDTSTDKLGALLNFFILISKQGWAHVVLASSDYSLVYWLLGKGVGRARFRVEAIGNLTEAETKTFFFGGATENEVWPGLINEYSVEGLLPEDTEKMWAQVYERCGGNIKLMRRYVLALAELKDWEAALDKIVERARLEVMKGQNLGTSRRGESPLWNIMQYKRVLQLIINAAHNAVSKRDMAVELGKLCDFGTAVSKNTDFRSLEFQLYNGVRKNNLDRMEGLGDKYELRGKGLVVLKSMLKYGLLAMRPTSFFAHDIPKKDFDGWAGEVVTLPSPAHVFVAKELLSLW